MQGPSKDSGLLIPLQYFTLVPPPICHSIVFTLANFRAQDNVIELYYLVDDPSLFTDNELPCLVVRPLEVDFRATAGK
mgnify:CR=1 FL=1